MEKILHLTLKKKWFDMILSGEKKEEYREVKPYWVNRFLDIKNYPAESEDEFKTISENIAYDIIQGYNLENVAGAYYSKIREFDFVVFRNGYSKNSASMVVEFKGITNGTAEPEWSDNWKGEVFIIKLGRILKTKNTK